MLTEKVKLLQKVALFAGGNVLLLQRSPEEHSRPGCWDLPGGNSEWPTGEQAGFGLHKADLIRELQEETGLLLQSTDFTHNDLVYFETFFDKPKQQFSVICGWRYDLPADFDPQSIRLSHEHTAFAWVQPDQLDQYDFGGDCGAFITEIISRGAAE